MLRKCVNKICYENVLTKYVMKICLENLLTKGDIKRVKYSEKYIN